MSNFKSSAVTAGLAMLAGAAFSVALAGAAGAAHSIRAGIYEEYPVDMHCTTTGACIVYFDKVSKDLIVDKVSCSLKMKSTNNPRVLRIALGRGNADKSSFTEIFILPAPQFLFTPGALIASSVVADTQTVIPNDSRTAVRADIVADAMSVDVTLSCAISGRQP
jgi:hypothetical protein